MGKRNKDKNSAQECEEFDFDTLTQMSNKISRDINFLRNVFFPHRFCMPNDPYGRNDLQSLLSNPATPVNKWPVLPEYIAQIPPADTQQYIEDFFSSMMDKMIAQYVNYAIENGMMKTYDEIVLKSNLVDISQKYKPKVPSRVDHPEITFENGQIGQLRTHDWYSFLPCFKNMTVKTNHKQYICVELLSVDEQNKSFKICLEIYAGDKMKWIRQNRLVMTCSFGNTQTGTLPAEFDVEEIQSYTSFLTKYIKSMKWSKQQTQMWLDIFGVYYPEDASLIQINAKERFPDMDDLEIGMGIIQNPEHLRYIKSHYNIPFNVIAQGATARQIFDDEEASYMLSEHLKLLAAINIALYTEQETTADELDEQGRTVRKFGPITVKSNTKITIPAKYKIAALKENGGEST